jgi:hypothetical protein
MDMILFLKTVISIAKKILKFLKMNNTQILILTIFIIFAISMFFLGIIYENYENSKFYEEKNIEELLTNSEKIQNLVNQIIKISNADTIVVSIIDKYTFDIYGNKKVLSIKAIALSSKNKNMTLNDPDLKNSISYSNFPYLEENLKGKCIEYETSNFEQIEKNRLLSFLKKFNIKYILRCPIENSEEVEAFVTFGYVYVPTENQIEKDRKLIEIISDYYTNSKKSFFNRITKFPVKLF